MNEFLSENEKEALQEFKRGLILDSCQISDKVCLKFLAARKFNVQRSIELYISHQNTRNKEDLVDVDPWDEEVKRELISAKLTVFSEGDIEGACVLLLTARFHFPNYTTHRAVLKGLVVQLDCALESLEAQRKGIVLIYDMTGSKFQNFDYDLSKKILNMLKGSYPARLKKVLIVMAPLWFKAPFKVLRHFILEKLRKRVHVIHPADLMNHLPVSSIPIQLGGTLHLDHKAWITKCLISTIRHDHCKPTLLPPIIDPILWSPLPCHITQKELDLYFEGISDALTHNVAPTFSMDKNVTEEIIEASRTSLPNKCPNTMTGSCFESDKDTHNDYENLDKDEDKKDGAECNMDTNVLCIDLHANVCSKNKGEEVPQISSRKRSASISDEDEPAKRRSNFNRYSKEGSTVQPLTRVTAFNDELPYSDESSSDESSESVTMELDVPSLANQSLTPSQIFKYWMMVGHIGLREEYFALTSEPITESFHICKMKANHQKNRYSDIPCLDRTRVRLMAPSDGSGYINANFVDGYQGQNSYISTQGPLQNTLCDFWQMVWEQAVLVIVMTTRTLERGRVKCEQYWPLEVNRMEQYNKICILNSAIEEKNEFVVTTLLLQDLKTEETRELKHVHFIGWPDHGTPKDTDTFLDMLEFVQNLQEEQKLQFYNRHVDTPHHNSLIHPILVHCSAGIGRTGTFIALDILARSLKNIGHANISSTVRKIRSQRALSIQMPDQYLFCYEALLCYAKRIGLLSYDDDDEDDIKGQHGA